MFELLVAAIGAPVAKHLVKQWLGDGLTAEIGGGLVDYLKDRAGSEREARRADRVVQDLADSVVERLQPFFETEAGKGVTIEPVVEALRLTLQAHANSRLILVHRLDPEELYKALQAAGRQSRVELDPPQQGLYDRALAGTSAALCAIAEKLPRFHAEATRASLEALDALAGQSDEILRQTRRIDGYSPMFKQYRTGRSSWQRASGGTISRLCLRSSIMWKFSASRILQQMHGINVLIYRSLICRSLLV